ncbi:MAG: xylulokinase [Rhizobiaceae bacterium]|jgi:xylulokinase|nr:xylulokinase [Rhizobiaceae bacterium]
MYLGVDLGTSSVKVALMDEHGVILDAASQELEVLRPSPGFSEQNPDEWIKATSLALDALRARRGAALAMVRGIGLSGHMHGATVLDSADKPLRPCILWNDVRSAREAAELDADPAFRHITGNIVFPGFTAPKLVWMRNNEPRLFAAAAKVLLPKDYLRLWLTGEHASDMSDSAGTSWLDTGERAWSGALLAKTGLGLSHMPRLVEGTQPTGTLRPDVAARFGMPSSAVVAGGGGDNAASAVGMGIVRDGDAFASLGTSGVLFAANAGYAPNPESAVHAFCHALPGTWHQMGVILSATDALNWHAKIVGASPAQLTDELGETVRAPGRVTFLPYLSGERTPHNDANIRGAFAGLGHEHDRAALTQAVLEGVAFAFRDSLAALEAAGTKLTRVVAVGGGSRSAYWLKALATVLGIPVDVPADGDFGAALGAARLGLIAAENADPLSVCTKPPITRSIEPQADLVRAFDDAYSRYRALYPALSGALS